MCSKCEFASKQRNALKRVMHPKSVFASKQLNVENEIKNRQKKEVYLLTKV